MKPLLWVLITFLGLYFAADRLLKQQVTSYALVDTDQGVRIFANRQGHYVGTGQINLHAMEFMIDTGATSVAIPDALAKKAGLTRGMAVVTQTAAGNVRAYQTVIPLLKIGSITMKNVRGVILEQLDQVLIGMTVLKHFKVTQFDGEMRIEVSE